LFVLMAWGANSMGVFDFFLGRPEDRFAKKVMRRLRQRGWPYPLSYASDRFTIESGEGGTTYLGRIFEDWLTYPPSRRQVVLDEALNFLFEAQVEGSYDEVADLLVPVVRHKGEFGALAFADGPIRPLAKPLALALAYDRPYSVQFINQAEVERMGRPFEELYERAVMNLRARSGGDFALQAKGYHILDYGDVYVSSRLLQPEIFRSLSLKGEPVVVAAARGVLLVAESEDTGALEAMARFGLHVVRTDARPIAYQPLVLRDGAWVHFEPGPEGPPGIHLLCIAQRIWDDVEEGLRLVDELAERGDDVHVAKLDYLETDGRFLTFAPWREGRPTLLPQAEALFLQDDRRGSILRRWEDVEAACGPFMQEPGLVPPRYRTGQPPSAETWKRLQTEHSPPDGWGELS